MKKIILLRGLVRESRHWGNFPKQLESAIADSTILTPEIQGVGRYINTSSPDNLIDMIEFMREQIKEHLGKDSIIMAMSLGGMIAKQWTEKYPDDFSKMILINTSYKGINPLLHRLKPSAIFQFLNIFITPHMGMREKKILDLVSNVPKKRDSILPEWIEIQKDAPVARESFINQIKAALKFQPSSQKPSLETLLIASKKDRLCDYNCTVKLSQLWNVPLKLHQSAGHDIPLDAPEWLIEKTKEFIQ